MKKKVSSGKLDIQQLLDEADNKEITQLTPDRYVSVFTEHFHYHL
jgi:hypothetical protein